MSDRTFRILFTVLYAQLAVQVQPDAFDPIAFSCLGLGTIAAYIIAYHIPLWARAHHEELAALL